jgi:hypothetical protein
VFREGLLEVLVNGPMYKLIDVPIEATYNTRKFPSVVVTHYNDAGLQAMYITNQPLRTLFVSIVRKDYICVLPSHSTMRRFPVWRCSYSEDLLMEMGDNATTGKKGYAFWMLY